MVLVMRVLQSDSGLENRADALMTPLTSTEKNRSQLRCDTILFGVCINARIRASAVVKTHIKTVRPLFADFALHDPNYSDAINLRVLLVRVGFQQVPEI